MARLKITAPALTSTFFLFFRRSLIENFHSFTSKMDGVKSGFFLNFYQNIRNTLKSDEIQAFTSLSTNGERFKYAHRVSHIEEKLELKRHDRDSKHQVNKEEIHFYKDAACAIEMKKIGNKFFQNQQWNDALSFYNKSYIMLPEECGKTFDEILLCRGEFC